MVDLKLPVRIASRGPNSAVLIADADNRIVCEIRRGEDDIAIAQKVVDCLNRTSARRPGAVAARRSRAAV